MQYNTSSSVHQIIGTQAIGSKYHFTSDDPVVEQAKRILEMGSNMIKISVKDESVLNAVLKMPFDTYFFWWRSDGKIWENGLSEADKALEYKATYEFTVRLLTTNPQVKRTYYLGNWEGDWYLINPNNPIEFFAACATAYLLMGVGLVQGHWENELFFSKQFLFF